MKLPVMIIIAFLLTGCLAAVSASAQQAIPVDEWKDFESWPVTKPGEMKLNTTALKNQRTTFDAVFRGPNGPEPTTMIMDVLNVYFRGRPAVWVQWTSTSRADRPDTAASLDMVIVDKQDFRALFRVASGPSDRKWAGNYNVVHYGPEQITNMLAKEDGTTETKSLKPETDVFEFATFQFLFPFLDLKEGAKYRLPGFERIANRYQLIPVRIGKQTTIRDAANREHSVREVQVISRDRSTLITFYLTQTAPFFYGWKYERVANGKTLISMTYRDWKPLE